MGYVRRVESEGRLVLPMEIRERFRLVVGTAMEFFLAEDAVIMRPYQPGCVFCGQASEPLLRHFRGRKVCVYCLVKARQDEWGFMRRRPGLPSWSPTAWAEPGDWEWTDNPDRADVLVEIRDGKAIVRAEHRDGCWVRAELEAGVEGKPKPCPWAARLAAWAFGLIREPEILTDDQVASLSAA